MGEYVPLLAAVLRIPSEQTPTLRREEYSNHRSVWGLGMERVFLGLNMSRLRGLGTGLCVTQEKEGRGRHRSVGLMLMLMWRPKALRVPL